MAMTQDETWFHRYQEMLVFLETNKRNPSRYNAEERGKYVNWLRHNKKLYNSREMKLERVGMFGELLSLCETYRGKNQYE